MNERQETLAQSAEPQRVERYMVFCEEVFSGLTPDELVEVTTGCGGDYDFTTELIPLFEKRVPALLASLLFAGRAMAGKEPEKVEKVEAFKAALMAQEWP